MNKAQAKKWEKSRARKIGFCNFLMLHIAILMFFWVLHALIFSLPLVNERGLEVAIPSIVIATFNLIKWKTNERQYQEYLENKPKEVKLKKFLKNK